MILTLFNIFRSVDSIQHNPITVKKMDDKELHGHGNKAAKNISYTAKTNSYSNFKSKYRKMIKGNTSRDSKKNASKNI